MYGFYLSELCLTFIREWHGARLKSYWFDLKIISTNFSSRYNWALECFFEMVEKKPQHALGSWGLRGFFFYITSKKKIVGYALLVLWLSWVEDLFYKMVFFPIIRYIFLIFSLHMLHTIYYYYYYLFCCIQAYLSNTSNKMLWIVHSSKVILKIISTPHVASITLI